MKVIVTSLAIFAVIGTAAALTCFVCNTERDSACGDELMKDSPALMNAFIKECEAKPNETAPFCRKTKEYMEVNGTMRVHRECGYKRRPIYDCYQNRAEDYVQNVCQCDEDDCNAAPTLTPLTPLLVLAIPVFGRYM